MKQWDGRWGSDIDKEKPKYLETKSYPCHRTQHKTHTNYSRCALGDRWFNSLNHGMDMRTALCWNITQRVVVISYWRFGKTCHIFKGQESTFGFLAPEDWTDRLSRNVGTKLTLLAAERRSHLLRSGSLQSGMAWTCIGRRLESSEMLHRVEFWSYRPLRERTPFIFRVKQYKNSRPWRWWQYDSPKRR
jgi:hypothetical protein